MYNSLASHFASRINNCSRYRLVSFVDTAPVEFVRYLLFFIFEELVMLLSSVCGDAANWPSKGRYSVADTHTCSIQPPKIRIVPWNPK